MIFRYISKTSNQNATILISKQEWEKVRKWLEKRKDILVFCDELDTCCYVANYNIVIMIASSKESEKHG